ncbi:hypothetical protein CXF72_17830 [Psychromonas sp. MB-3u-54]|uniref:restriction endonuclease n=1 Tax=Psychromonas sp. MB-3u-54 TaxID=2058319 RepID=UPI000C3224CD|nr:restriction endonuclease [Psychromonas sp. MB-3u-54]PKH01272.1 hypothetical protein CXF72_17830 [Psychromonas sp. MB-3u-54]
MRHGYGIGALVVMWFVAFLLVSVIIIIVSIEGLAISLTQENKNWIMLFSAVVSLFIIKKKNAIKINNYLKSIKDVAEEVEGSIRNLYMSVNDTMDGFSEFGKHYSIERDGCYVRELGSGNEEFEVYQSLSWAVQCILLSDFKRQHLVQLKRDYKRLISTDEYGISSTNNWDKKINQIIKSILLNKYHIELQNIFDNLSCIKGLHVNYDDEDIAIKGMEELLFDDLEEETYKESIDLDYEIEITPEMTGLEYEHTISNFVNVNSEHWTSHVTQGSGDQGLDVMIQSTVFDFQIAVQCKLYNSPVGNKAVQEVNAAHLFYNTDLACVVTNNSFTKSAHALALATNIMLLHHDSLFEWLEEISNELHLRA